MADTKDMILSRMRRDVLEKTLAKGMRFDGRAADQWREVKFQKGAIATSEGSALAQIGGTKVLASLKFDIATPFSDRPKEGVFISNAELLCTASPTFESGPPNEDSIEFARVVDRGIRSAEIIDVKSFFIEEGKVLALYLDLYVLDHTGNYTDTGSLAAAAALMDCRIPKVEDGKIIRGEYSGPLNPKELPVSTTFTKIGDTWLLDPSRDEERAHETRLTIATTRDHVCAMQKGKGSLSKAELMDLIDLSFKKGNELRDILSR